MRTLSKTQWQCEWRRVRSRKAKAHPAAVQVYVSRHSVWEATVLARARWMQAGTMRCHQLSLMKACHLALGGFQPRLP
jgi:hypothetical protein